MTPLIEVSDLPEAAVFVKFPVKFLVSRENGQSRGSSALLRQPASPVSGFRP
jgi:hypothetical protein